MIGNKKGCYRQSKIIVNIIKNIVIFIKTIPYFWFHFKGAIGGIWRLAVISRCGHVVRDKRYISPSQLKVIIDKRKEQKLENLKSQLKELDSFPIDEEVRDIDLHQIYTKTK